MKTCPKCGKVKDCSAFGNNKSRADGLEVWCRECRSAMSKKYRTENPAPRKSRKPGMSEEDRKNRRQENDKKRRATHRDKFRAYEKKRRLDNPEISRSRARKVSSELTDSYIRMHLGLTAEECTPELIEAKREQMRLFRAIRELKKELKCEINPPHTEMSAS